MNLNGSGMPMSIENQKSNLTITDKVDMIERNIYEITCLANEISSRIYGSSTPKIENNECCGVPISKNIENTLNNIRANSTDIMHMLQDVLNNL